MNKHSLSRASAALTAAFLFLASGCGSTGGAGGAGGAPGGMAGCGGAGAEAAGPVDCGRGMFEDPATHQCKRFTSAQRSVMRAGQSRVAPTNTGP